MRKLFLVCLVLFYSALLQGGSGHPFNIVKEEIRIPLRDGVHLGATLYRPDQEGKFPAIVCRTPYGKDEFDSSEFPLKAAKSGYLVFLVDAVKKAEEVFGKDNGHRTSNIEEKKEELPKSESRSPQS